jgi:hypothetical protein
VRDRPAVVLIHHFFTSLFDFGILSEAGAEALKRVLLGGLALLIAGGLLLTRVFLAKYGELAAAGPDVYAREIVADHAFLMALPMWMAASAMALVGQSLFPDETDFRILMAEPLSRLVVFGAKLGALLLFGGLFIAGTHVGVLPLAALTLIGASATGSFFAAAAAFAAASLAASLFAALAILAVHGLLVLLASRSRLLAFSGAVRSLLIGGLVLALPLVTRLPAAAGAFEAEAWWLAWAPPAWFVGLERWLLGDATHGALAAQAAIATVAAAAITVVAYVRLYARFDRVTFQSAGRAPAPGGSQSIDGAYRGTPVRGAVQRFVTLTIRRSVLHQGLVVGLLAGAGGVVLNSLLSADWRPGRVDTAAGGALVWTLLWVPMTMMFLSIPAIRLALSVPMDLRANWIFRMTEDVDGRIDVAEAGVRTVLALAVALPIAAIAPLQWWVMGRGVVAVVLVEAAIGWLFVECRMADWRRVPFTCSYIPGKGFFPQMCVKALAWYVTFTFATGLMLRASLREHRVAMVLAVGFAVTAAVLRLRRTRNARESSLLFEEQLPTELTPLRLSAD